MKRFKALRINFNSIKVRLEPSETFGFVPRFTFQFHKGTIRTTVPLLYLLISNLFQFHKGTIRTTHSYIFVKVCPYFNSIKVRLELILVLRLRKILSNFNSIKVRLELRLRSRSSICNTFQFHKGTIRT